MVVKIGLVENDAIAIVVVEVVEVVGGDLNGCVSFILVVVDDDDDDATTNDDNISLDTIHVPKCCNVLGDCNNVSFQTKSVLLLEFGGGSDITGGIISHA
jgi:hypothetical protein